MKLLFKILFAALIAKAIALLLLFFLPTTGIECIPPSKTNLYHNYPLAHAFGLSNTNISSTPPPSDTLHSLTNFTLKAIYSEGTRGVIVLEDGSKTYLLATGEQLKGYTLTAVYPTKAIFEKDGKRYVLELPSKVPWKIEQTTPQKEHPSAPSLYKISRRDIRYFKNHAQTIWHNISIQEQFDPVTRKLKGFLVTKVNKNSIFGKIGLQKGDLIIGANGHIFQSLSDVLRLYNEIDKFSRLRLLIVRNNEKKELEYEID